MSRKINYTIATYLKYDIIKQMGYKKCQKKYMIYNKIAEATKLELEEIEAMALTMA